LRRETPVADLAADFRAMLDEARAALNKGDAIESESRAKAVLAIVRAEREVAAFLSEQRTASLENDDEACRAELQRRLALYARAGRSGAPPEVLARIASTGSAT
jgi:hypothetical protein